MSIKKTMCGLLAASALSLAISPPATAGASVCRTHVSASMMFPQLVGHKVHVVLVDKQFFDGLVVAQDGDSITLRINNQDFEIPLAQIEHIQPGN
jgi:hypothetical protein